MYSLYFECPNGRLGWICDVDDAVRARPIARFSSKDGLTVTIVRRFDDGATGLLGTFPKGSPDTATAMAL